MNDINLPESWTPTLPSDAHKFEIELEGEICKTHPLSGTTFMCVARRDGQDDFLFRLESHERAFAVVHLTWSQETEPDFPWTTFFASEQDFIDNWRRIFD
jgi:hypothetical protein